MRKLILVFTVIAISVGAYAQTDSTTKKMNPPDINNTEDGLHQNRDMNVNQNQNWHNNPVDKSHSDGVIMQNGKMMKVKNGQITDLDDDMTLSNGTKIMRDGTCIKKDGTKMTMKEGQHIDMSGTMTPEKTNKDKNIDFVPDSTRKRDY